MEKWEKKLIRKFKPKYNKTCKDGFFEEESPNANRTSRMEWCNKNKIWYTQVYKRMWDKSHGVESYKIIKIYPWKKICFLQISYNVYIQHIIY